MKDMNPYLRNFLAVLVGLIVGGIVNITVIKILIMIFGVPDGVELTDMNSIKAHIGEFSTLQLISPLGGHAIGTLAGAYLTARLVTKARMFFGFLIGIFFLLGGLMAINQVPGSPLWFILVDLIVAYLPMAVIGVKLTGKKDE